MELGMKRLVPYIYFKDENKEHKSLMQCVTKKLTCNELAVVKRFCSVLDLFKQKKKVFI